MEYIRLINKRYRTKKDPLLGPIKTPRKGYDCYDLIITTLKFDYKSEHKLPTLTISNGRILETLTISQLKKISRENKIKLGKNRKKKEILKILQNFFKKKNRRSKMNILSSIFRIDKDAEGRFNISLWFRKSRSILKSNRL